MKTIAAIARPACAGALLLCAGLIAGCAMPDKPQRPQPYDLGPALPVVDRAERSEPARPPLALGRVESPAAIDSTQIIYRLLYVEGGQQPRPYAQASWTMPPAQLLSQRLREALAASRPVLEPGMGLAALELRVELDEFAHVFQSPDASEGLLRLRVTAIAPSGRQQRLLGQRSFSVRQPAPSADAAGGVAALRAATDEALRQVLQWLDELPTPPATGQLSR